MLINLKTLRHPVQFNLSFWVKTRMPIRFDNEKKAVLLIQQTQPLL